MVVLASAFDRNLGGRDFDMVRGLFPFSQVGTTPIMEYVVVQAMLNHFAAEWKTKTGAYMLFNFLSMSTST